jgi:hypothetical protein
MRDGLHYDDLTKVTPVLDRRDAKAEEGVEVKLHVRIFGLIDALMKVYTVGCGIARGCGLWFYSR